MSWLNWSQLKKKQLQLNQKPNKKKGEQKTNKFEMNMDANKTWSKKLKLVIFVYKWFSWSIFIFYPTFLLSLVKIVTWKELL